MNTKKNRVDEKLKIELKLMGKTKKLWKWNSKLMEIKKKNGIEMTERTKLQKWKKQTMH